MKKDKNNIELTILMLGPARCGKSSTLYAMVSSFQKMIETEGEISFTPDSYTENLFRERYGNSNPMEVFNSRKSRDEHHWTVDTDRDYETRDYVFDLNMKHAKNKYVLRFKDIPGEFVYGGRHSEDIQKMMSESDVIIVAIDTPHLMEEEGTLNGFNYPKRITSLFFNYENSGDEKKLVLFVPIKCEKYMHEVLTESDKCHNSEIASRTNPLTINDVVEAIKESYKVFFANNEQKRVYSVAITPVLTMGGIIFDDFERDSDGFVIMDRMTKNEPERPRNAYFKLYDMDPTYNPRFCEQPMLYVLNYMLQLNKERISKLSSQKDERSKIAEIIKLLIAGAFGLSGLFVWLMVKMLSDEKAVSNTAKYLKLSGNGYQIVTDLIGFEDSCRNLGAK